MAGTLGLTEDLCWVPAGWVYDNVLRSLAEDLQTTDPELANSLLAAQTFENGGYLDLRAAPPKQVDALAAATNRLFSRTQQAGPQSFDAPEFFPGFVRELDELRRLLQEAGSGGTT